MRQLIGVGNRVQASAVARPVGTRRPLPALGTDPRPSRSGHGDAGPRSAQPPKPGRPLSLRAAPPRHQRRHQPRRVRPRAPLLPTAGPGSNNEAQRRDRGPGLRRRQPRGRRISILEAFLCVLLCLLVFQPECSAQPTPRYLAAGPPRQNAAALVSEAGRAACGGPLPPALPSQTSFGTTCRGTRKGQTSPQNLP